MEENIQKILYQDLPTTHYGTALSIYLLEEIEKLNDITTIQNWEDTLGRKHAVVIIKKILRFLNTDKKEIGKKTDYR